MHKKTPNSTDPTGVREITTKMPVIWAQGPKSIAVTKIMMQPEGIKIRPGGGMIKTRSNGITARVGGTCSTSGPAAKMQDL